MTSKNPKDRATSVRTRLLNHAKRHGDDYQRVLTRYAIERLLFRLSQTEAAERYVLKGAMLFVTWPEHVFRPTGDLDLLGHGDPDPVAITELFTRICQVEAPDDGLVEAVGGTLRRRETAIPSEMPVGLSETFARIAEARGLWNGFLRRNPPTLQPPPFADLQQELRRFFGPVIASLALPEGAKGRWDPDSGAWR